MSAWQIGDRAIFVAVSGDSPNPYHYGQVCELLEYVGAHRTRMDQAWAVRFTDKDTYVHERCLRPIPDTYDGLSVTTWDECPFKPRELVQ